jgi:diaminopimelate epimerase
MHGIGNDYVYVNCFEERISAPAGLARAVSDRHRGIGADGLILVCPSQVADVRMRIFNADGSEAEMCGNGIRCLAKYVYERKLVRTGGAFCILGGNSLPVSLRVETGRGVLTVGLAIDKSNKVQKVCVNLGEPILSPQQIPVNIAADRVVQEPLEVEGQQLQMTCVSMGNPHAVFFCDDVGAIDLDRLGPSIESYPVFPNRTNVHFVQVRNRGEFLMRSWERGSGITLACGTGACACCVAAVLIGRCDRLVTAYLPGGQLEINWSAQNNCVYMTGEAVEVFSGIWPD